jgi:hypothetical protein
VLAQDIQCSLSLGKEERTRILASLTAMEEAIQVMSWEIDAISADNCEPKYPTQRRGSYECPSSGRDCPSTARVLLPRMGGFADPGAMPLDLVMTADAGSR